MAKKPVLRGVLCSISMFALFSNLQLVRAMEYKDIWSYCKSAGTIDKPNQRLMSKATEKRIRGELNEQEGNIEWRCMDGFVYACAWINGPICSKRTGAQDIEGIKRFCRENPNQDLVPGVVTGHRDPSITWACKGRKAVIIGGDFRTDKRDYPVEVWKLIHPPW
jgi:hypothetical protein